jgi:copper chaperone NosL
VRVPLLLLVVVTSGCASGPAQPVSIDTRNDSCAYCRMVVSDPRVAAQIVAPGEEAKVFDDIGCLRDYVAKRELARDAAVFVADHRTGEWVPARYAVYTVSTGRRTPMSSGIVAHGSRASRDGDPAAAGGVDVPVRAILGEGAQKEKEG